MTDAIFTELFHRLVDILNHHENLARSQFSACTFEEGQAVQLCALFRAKAVDFANTIEQAIRICTPGVASPPMRVYMAGNYYRCTFCGITLEYLPDPTLRHPTNAITCPHRGKRFELPTVDLKEVPEYVGVTK